MIEVVPVGDGFLVLVERRVSNQMRDEFPAMWMRRFPRVPMMLIEEAQLRTIGDAVMFEFSGDLSAVFLDEFRAWWDARMTTEQLRAQEAQRA